MSKIKLNDFLKMRGIAENDIVRLTHASLCEQTKTLSCVQTYDLRALDFKRIYNACKKRVDLKITFGHAEGLDAVLFSAGELRHIYHEAVYVCMLCQPVERESSDIATYVYDGSRVTGKIFMVEL